MKRLWPSFCLLLLLVPALPAPAQMGAFNVTAMSGRDCATCHMDWVNSFKKPGAVLLIEAPVHSVVTDDDTCLGCHDGAVADDRHGVWMEHGHRTNLPPTPDIHVPDKLPLQDGKISCRTCHTAHANPSSEGLTNVIFLRMPNDAGQLCLACHGEKGQGAEHGTHPLGAMRLAIPDVLLQAGARGGSDGKTVSCQSCHRPHGAQDEHLLVMDGHSNALCLSCHAQLESGMSLPHVAGRHPVEHELSAVEKKAVAGMGTLLGPKETLGCMSCHMVHKGQPGGFLLAQPLIGSQLCLNCHDDHKTVAGTRHDLRQSAPEEKNKRGQTVAQSGLCGTCHGVHTDARAPLAGPGDPAGVCMTCHAKDQITAQAPGASWPGISFAHPADIPAQRLATIALPKLYPGRLNAQDRTLRCLTCHNPHDASHPQFLREKREDLCADCHADKLKSLAGAHDFSANPAARNGLGASAQEVGKCGFCHDVHRFKGPVLWTATDAVPASPDDLCIQCHRAGGLAAKKPAFAFSHLSGPKAVPPNPATVALPLFNAAAQIVPGGFVSCASCHDPHADSRQSPSLLRLSTKATTSALCLQCHADKAALRKGPHDQSVSKKPWPTQPELIENNACLACHQAHSNDPAKQLWTVVLAPGQVGTNGVCIACHNERQWAGDKGQIKIGNMLHPRALGKDDAASLAARRMPLMDVPAAPATRAAQGEAPPQQIIGCRTCHDPHADPAAPHLLRLGSGQKAQDLCTTCHQDVAPLAHSPHRLDSPQILALQPGPQPAPTCSPCHAVHAIQSSQRQWLWTAPIYDRASADVDQHCLGCHGPGGQARQPQIFQHPQAAFASLAFTAKPGQKPPETDMTKLFSCATCHYTHGSEIPGIQQIAAQGGGPALEAAARPMVRSGIAETVCRNCHGADAPRVFLYYHQPQRRAVVGFMAHPP